MASQKKAPAKEIFGWAMFDFANSSYTTVIITVVFSVIFPRIIVGDGPDFRMGNFYWSLALSLGYLLTVALSPPLGAVMDATASKRLFLFTATAVTVISTGLLYFVTPGLILAGILLIVLSNTGFSLGESFVSSFLPGLGPKEALGKISAYAWGLGYFGGLLSVGSVMFTLAPLTLENFESLRWTGPITALFFGVASLPAFFLLKDRSVPHPHPPHQGYIRYGFRQVFETAKHLKQFRDLTLFLISLFFAMAGLSIMITFSFIYGDQVIGWSPRVQMLMFIITQFTAAGGALLFGYLQDRVGAKFSYNLTLLLWIVSVLFIFWIQELTPIFSALLGTDLSVETLFLVAGSLAGAGLGATQSSSRTIVGILAPEGRSGEFFGFWGLSGKLASIFGVIGIGLLQSQLGLENSILLCSLFFGMALIVSLFVNENRGLVASEDKQQEFV